MKNIFYKVLLLALILLQLLQGFAQDLNPIKLSKEDRSNGVKSRYEFLGRGHFSCVLLLFSNGTYRYEESMLTQTFNIGTWSERKNEIILKDTLDKNNIPITLQFLNKSDTSSDFVIQIVRNLNSELLTDGLVYINNDSNQCLPLTGTCLQKFEKIDSVKFVFENGYKSKWIKVAENGFAQILPVLQANFLMYTYASLRHTRYKLIKGCLKPL